MAVSCFGMLSEVRQIIQKLSLEELLICREDINKAISTSYLNNEDKIILNREESKSKNIEDYIEYHPNYISSDSVEWAGIVADIDSLGIKCRGGNTATTWLTNAGVAYTWETNAGKPIVKDPIDIGKCVFINRIMQDINTKHGLDLNSCLVTVLASGHSSLRIHNDNEESLDGSQPICIVSQGAIRTVDFFNNSQRTLSNTFVVYHANTTMYHDLFNDYTR